MTSTDPANENDARRPDAPPPPPAMDYAPPGVPPPAPRSRLRNFARFTSGVFAGFIILFIPTFFAGATGFEQSLPWWAWPALGAATLICAAYAWFTRRRSPATSAGMWVGIALGLLLAGACFMGM